MEKFKLPLGQVEPDGRIKLAVMFTPDNFKKLRARAAKEKKRFSAVLNDVVACGLFDLEEQERDEPVTLRAVGRDR